MQKNYAIFDMDGTLVDSMGYWDNVVIEYLHDRGFTGDFQNLLLRIKTMSVPEGAEEVAKTFCLTETVEEITDAMNSIMEHHYREDVMLKPGAREYLHSLKARGVKLCIASTTCQSLIEQCLESRGIRDLFEFCLSSELIGVGKGQPDVYLEAVRRLGAAPEDTAVFEDALYAMKTAKKAGFYVVGVYDHEEETNWPSISEFADETIVDYRNL